MQNCTDNRHISQNCIDIRYILCLLCSHLCKGKEFFVAVSTAEGLLLFAVAGLVLAECLGGGEALVTLVAREHSILLKNGK